MDFRQLESFLAVTKYKSFSKASRELFLTQPALSNQIKNLEKELQTALFDRKGKTIELTASGKLFREHAIQLIKKKEAALFDINSFMDRYDGTIEIPCSTVPSETIMPEIISRFTKNYPGIIFKIFSMDSSDVIESLEEKKYSLGFVGSKPNSDFESIKVYSDDMVFIGSSLESLHRNSISLRDILDLPLIVREPGSGSGDIIDQQLKREEISREDLTIVAITENVHIMKQLVASGLGFAFIPRSSIVDCPHSKIKIYEVDGLNSSRNFYFIKPKNGLLSPLENQFCEFIAQNFK